MKVKELIEEHERLVKTIKDNEPDDYLTGLMNGYRALIKVLKQLQKQQPIKTCKDCVNKGYDEYSGLYCCPEMDGVKDDAIACKSWSDKVVEPEWLQDAIKELKTPQEPVKTFEQLCELWEQDCAIGYGERELGVIKEFLQDIKEIKEMTTKL